MSTSRAHWRKNRGLRGAVAAGAALGLFGAALAGCSRTSPAGSGGPTGVTRGVTTSSGAGLAAGGPVAPTATVAQSFVVHDMRSVNRIALLDGYVVLTTCGPCREGDPPDRLVSLDRRTGAQALRIRTAFSGGQIDWVVGAGDTAIFTDQSRVQDDDNQTTVWTLNRLDLATGARSVLASSGGRADDDLPEPVVSAGHVLWVAQRDGRPVVAVADVRSGVATYRDVGGIPAGFGVIGNELFVGVTGSDGVPTTFRYPLAGGPGQQLAGTRGLGGPLAAGDSLVWSTPAGQEADTLYAARPGQQPRQIHLGVSDSLAAGAGFVALMEEASPEAVRIVSTSTGASVVPPYPVDIPSRLDTDGDQLVFSVTSGLFTARQSTRIYVETVRAG